MGSTQFGVDTDAIQLFAKNLSRAIDTYGETTDPKERYLRQKKQMETLVALEKDFRKTLIAHSWGNYVYRRFVTFICEEKRNILAARPYFRERQKVFTEEISKALKKRSEKTLYRFHFNFQFVLFCMKSRPWKPRSPVTLLYKQIHALREEIVSMNMPLALNRARLFFSKTPTSHLTYMDFVQISSEGLMSGVDKYCLPFSSNFRAVLIGRMLGNFIENYSETPLHFYPVDKRKIYRANKNASKHVNGIDYDRLSDEVNKNPDGKLIDKTYRTTPGEIASLMAAASTVSADSGTVPGAGHAQAGGMDELDVPKLVDRFEAPEDTRPDVMVEKHQALGAMYSAIDKDLTLVEKKFLRLKGLPTGTEGLLAMVQ